MIDFFINLNPYFQALFCSLGTFTLTILGSFMIFFVNNNNSKNYDRFLAISAGIMLSSSIFSLIIPALNYTNEIQVNSSILLSIGMLCGSLILFVCDIYGNSYKRQSYGNLLLSMIIHNIPEGMAIGLAFASVYYTKVGTVMGAISLAIGIGIQNFPEGSAISFPLHASGFSKLKSAIIGGLSAAVEPFGAIIGVFIAAKFSVMLPFLLSLAFGSMIYVIITELIPDIMSKKNKELLALYLVFGFIIMMILDISLG